MSARWRRWLGLGSGWIEGDVEDELAFHREMLERDFRRAGLGPEEARAAADARFGDVREVKRWLTRHDRGRVRRLEIGERIMDVLSDVRHGVRKLVQQPAFTLAVVAVLALGTGATTAIFSAVDAVLLRPLPFEEPERLVLLQGLDLPFDPGIERESSRNEPDITDARALDHVFDEIAAYAAGGLNLTDEASPRRLRVGAVTPNLFAALGVAPILGRTFSPVEEVPGAVLTAILSERLWRSHFAADPSVLGRSVVLNGESYEIVGVMPLGFAFPEASEVWLPLTVPYTFDSMEPFRQYLPYSTLARLAPDVTIDEAETRLRALYGAYASATGPSGGIADEPVRPFREGLVRERRTALLLLLAATGLVLVVACANVANLLLSRGTGRRRELALRSALGATGGRLLRQLSIESLVLAAAGAGAGLALAFAGIRLLNVLVPPALSGVASLRVDARVLGFCLLLALATSVVFGLLPALEGRRADAGAALRTGATGSGGDGRGALVRRAFVVGEVALALMLLVGSTLMLRSLHALVTTDSGIQTEGVATLELTLGSAEYETAELRRGFFEDVLERLANDPRVEAAAAINELPLRGVQGVRFLIHPVGQAPRGQVDIAQMASDLRITPDYFRAMGIGVIAGRAPLPTSATGGEREVAISESLARVYWPAVEVPIGEYMEGLGGALRIVGVVEDVRPTTLESDFIPQAYYALLPNPYPNAALVARGPGSPESLARILQDAVRAVAPTQAVYNVRSMEEVIEGAIQTRRTNTFLITTFGALALLLSAVGVYGVMAYSVARRTREIGVRIALGARSRQVMGGVLREGLLLAGIGAALGLGGAWALSRVMEGLLYGVTTTDPLTFALAPAALLVVALAAALLPAWRATRVNPMEAMRVE
jgi:predicted permease